MQLLPLNMSDDACVLDHVGVAGQALPGSGATTPDVAGCRALCGRTAGCTSYQWMYDTHACWLKGTDGVYGENGDSASGPLNCSQAFMSVQVLALASGNGTAERLVVLNAAPTTQTVALPIAAAFSGPAVHPATLADAYRQNISIAELAHTTVSTSSASVTLPPFSIALLEREG